MMRQQKAKELAEGLLLLLTSFKLAEIVCKYLSINMCLLTHKQHPGVGQAVTQDPRQNPPDIQLSLPKTVLSCWVTLMKVVLRLSSFSLPAPT